MKKTELRAAMLIAIALAPGAAIAVAALPEFADEQVSVRELMRLETAHAIHLLRARRPQTATPEQARRPAMDTREEPRLTAIYGVGKSLMAEVAFGPRTYLYRRGQVLPAGVAPDAHVYLLQDISSSCVRLKRESAQRRLCLDGTRAVGARQ